MIYKMLGQSFDAKGDALWLMQIFIRASTGWDWGGVASEFWFLRP